MGSSPSREITHIVQEKSGSVFDMESKSVYVSGDESFVTINGNNNSIFLNGRDIKLVLNGTGNAVTGNQLCSAEIIVNGQQMEAGIYGCHLLQPSPPIPTFVPDLKTLAGADRKFKVNDVCNLELLVTKCTCFVNNSRNKIHYDESLLTTFSTILGTGIDLSILLEGDNNHLVIQESHKSIGVCNITTRGNNNFIDVHGCDGIEEAAHKFEVCGDDNHVRSHISDCTGDIRRIKLKGRGNIVKIWGTNFTGRVYLDQVEGSENELWANSVRILPVGRND